MKTTFIYSIAFAVSLPLASLAQDKGDPGKSGDAVKDPGTTAPARPVSPLRMPNENEREPGKTSDSVKEPDPAAVQKKFSGEITSVNREDKTITINDSGRGSQKLQLGDSTKIEREGKSASWDDLKIGARVEGTSRGGAEIAHAESITIGG
jgi:hypothetical protein